MSLCSKCGAEISQGAKFCKGCGSGLHTTDPALEQKKTRVLADEKKGARTMVMVLGTVFVILAGWALYHTYLTRPGEGPSKMLTARTAGAGTAAYVPVSAEKGEIRLPLGNLQGPKAGFYVYSFGGKEIKFFLLRATDGTVRAAFDACTSCYHAKLGYRQDGEHMVCNNCGMGFRSTDIGVVTGGCNPIPLEKTMDGQTLVLKTRDLEAGLKYF